MYPYPIYYPFTNTIQYYKEAEPLKKKEKKEKKEKKVTKPLPPRDKVCSQCGQQYHWCVCYLNKYQ